MEHGKKLFLMSESERNNLCKESKAAPKISTEDRIKSPEVLRLESLDSQLLQTIDNKSMIASEKVKKYNELLSEFQMSLEHLKRGNNSIASQEPTQNQLGSTSIPVRENDFVSVLVSNLPKDLQKKGRVFLDSLSKVFPLSMSEAGELVIGSETLENSSATKLVSKLLRNGPESAKLTRALPVGWNKFMEKIAGINFTSLNNKKSPVKGSASTSTKTLKTKPSKRLQQTKLPKKITKTLKTPALSSAKWIELKH